MNHRQIWRSRTVPTFTMIRKGMNLLVAITSATAESGMGLELISLMPGAMTSSKAFFSASKRISIPPGTPEPHN